MFHERFLRYSHLPHQVANNNIDCQVHNYINIKLCEHKHDKTSMLTRDIVCNYVYEQHSPPKYCKETFKKLLQIAPGGYFHHRGKQHCQIDGVTTGSPLRQTLGNFLGGHLENRFMTQQDIFMPVYYSRYVDDILCAFSSSEYVQMFLNFLNNLHHNLKFTYEIGPHKLAFLDIIISLSSIKYLV